MQTVALGPRPVAVFPFQWMQGPRNWPTYEAPESFFAFGNPDTGKSNQAMAFATNFIDHGATAIDVHGADNDAETLVWLLSPYKDKAAVVIGEDVEVEMPFEKISISDFTMEEAEKYSAS